MVCKNYITVILVDHWNIYPQVYFSKKPDFQKLKEPADCFYVKI